MRKRQKRILASKRERADRINQEQEGESAKSLMQAEGKVSVKSFTLKKIMDGISEIVKKTRQDYLWSELRWKLMQSGNTIWQPATAGELIYHVEVLASFLLMFAVALLTFMEWCWLFHKYEETIISFHLQSTSTQILCNFNKTTSFNY